MRKHYPPCVPIELPWTTKADWDDLGLLMGSEGRALVGALYILVPFFLLEVLKEVLR